MSRYVGPKCKRMRRVAMDLSLKSGSRPIADKCKIDQRPGQHPNQRGKLTEYGEQLREKQRLRYMYGIQEKQFRSYYKKAAASKGVTGENLFVILESRLDNVIYRMGFATTRAEARQLVSHKAIMVNGVVVNVPSSTVKEGDNVQVREKAKKQERIIESLNTNFSRGICDWVEVLQEEMKGTFTRLPKRTELNLDIDESKVVEFYSR
ncbi:MAG: 30S ribosomal protein S4 [Nitrospinota bacterium]|nr:30S ribosomal protein S4 [Nitrospinota bacterium]